MCKLSKLKERETETERDRGTERQNRGLWNAITFSRILSLFTVF